MVMLILTGSVFVTKGGSVTIAISHYVKMDVPLSMVVALCQESAHARWAGRERTAMNVPKGGLVKIVISQYVKLDVPLRMVNALCQESAHARWAGWERTAMSVPHTQAVILSMAPVRPPGNVTALMAGLDNSAIKHQSAHQQSAH